MMSRKPTGLLASALAGCAIAVAGCAGLPTEVTGDSGSAEQVPSLVGTWSPSDGTSEKTLDAGGNCRGFFYNSGKPLDIGGPMSCQLSSAPDSSGRYRLLVTQGGNRATYLVEFDGADAASVYSKNGAFLYALTRF